MCAYRTGDVAGPYGAFVAFYFMDGEAEPKLHAGAFHTTWHELLVEYDSSEDVQALSAAALASSDDAMLSRRAAGPNSEWLYDERPWAPGDPDADVAWAVERLTAAASAITGR